MHPNSCKDCACTARNWRGKILLLKFVLNCGIIVYDDKNKVKLRNQRYVLFTKSFDIKNYNNHLIPLPNKTSVNLEDLN